MLGKLVITLIIIVVDLLSLFHPPVSIFNCFYSRSSYVWVDYNEGNFMRFCILHPSNRLLVELLAFLQQLLSWLALMVKSMLRVLLELGLLIVLTRLLISLWRFDLSKLVVLFEFWVSYQSCFLPKVYYKMPVLTFFLATVNTAARYSV